MADTIAFGALLRKRAEMAGRIEHAYTELEGLLADVAALDTTLRLFDPDVHLEAIRPRPLRTTEVWAARPHVFVRRVLEEQGLDPGDPKVWTPASEGVCKALRSQKRRRIVRSTPGEGQQLLWEMAEGWAEATVGLNSPERDSVP